MTRYYVRYDVAAAALVPVTDTTPHDGEGRRVLARAAVAGGALAFGVSVMRLPAPDLVTELLAATAGVAALTGGMGLALKMGADGVLEWRRQSEAFFVMQRMGTVQTVQPNLTPRTLPAPAEIVMPDTPVSHAERDARHEALRLLTAAAGIVGWDGDTIPRYTRLRWGNERRARAVASLAQWLDVTPGKETRVRDGTLKDLHDRIAHPTPTASAAPSQ